MSKLSHKTLLIIFFFLLIAVIVVSKFVLPNKKVSASWWNDSWHYRKAISLTNSSGSNLTDFQVSISIGTSALIASGKMQSDCDDIRITDINGNILPYWIEENNPGCNQITDTKIWLKATSLPTSGSIIYFYYGNSSANSASDGNKVFELFDNFSNGLNNWVFFPGAHIGGTLSATVSNGQMILSGVNAEGGLYKKNYSTTNGVVEFMARADQLRNGNDMAALARWQNNSQYYDMGVNWGDNTTSRISRDSSHVNLASVSYTYGSGVFRLISGSFIGSSLRTYIDNNFKVGVTDSTYSSSGNVGIVMDAQHESSGLNVQWTIDDFRVRKAVEIEPTPSIQSEEVGTAPIAYWKFDEGVGTTAYDSAGNNHGVISGATYLNEDQCISKKCLSFNSNIITSTNTPSLNFSGDFTISLWIKPNNNTSYQGVIAKMDNITTNGYRITLRNNGKIWCDLGNANSSSGSHNVNYSANVWQYITCQRSGSNIRVYVNGVLQEEVSANNNSINAISDLYIGRQASIEYLYGYLDEVKIYPYARTADQIKQDYNSRGSSKGSSVNLGIKSNTAPSIKSSLVAYYKFDENNGTVATNSVSGGSGLNGIFGSGSYTPTWTNNGKSNKALSFDGTDDFIRIPQSSTINSLNQFTLSFWVKHDGTNVDNYIFYKGSASPSFTVNFGSNTMSQEYWTTAGARTTATTINNVSPNQWHHIAFTFKENAFARSYLDGELIQNNPSVGSIRTNSEDLYFNTYAGTVGSYNVKGIFDEVKIYNTALTAEEIKQDYNAGSAIQFGSTNQTIGGTTTNLEYCIPGDTSYCAPPIAEWKMDEKVGTSIVDTSGNNFTGTITTATWSQGKIGGALNFRGDTNDDYVSTSYPSSVPSSFTAEAWIKPDSVFGSGERSTYGYTIMAASYDGSRYPVWITVRNGEIRASAFVGALAYTETSGANLQPNQWYHIAVSATQNSTATIYINGISKTSFTAGNVAWDVSDKMTIADLRPGRNISFDGLIDHVKIYNYARTPAQIAYDYNKGGPVGWWKFDECQGNIAYDWSGIGNTGSINIGNSGSQNSLGTCAVGTSAAWTNGASGKINSSLNFDGNDDYVSIGDPPNGSLDFGFNDFSTSAWFKTTSSSTSIILGKYNSYPLFYTNINSGVVGSRIGFDASTNYISSNGNTVNDGNWHQIVVVYKRNGSMTKYIDGKNYGTSIDISSSSSTSVSTTNSFTIGASGGSTQFFPGQIDDVRIYNYALTPEQVKTVYNNGSVSFQ